MSYIKEKRLVLVTSIGMNTWDLPLALAASQGLDVLVISPFRGEDHQTEIRNLIWRFHLNKGKSAFFFLKSPVGKGGKTAWPVRDREIAAIADQLIPVSIRPGGNLEQLLNQYHEKIVNCFTIPYKKASRPRPKYSDYRCRTDLANEDFLIHFTRSVPGPWPDETDFDYYRAVIESRNEYCRSAAKTLLHILDTKTIYASARNIRDHHRVVGFTRLSPEHVSALFRYRRRLVNPYFEPYGIGIHMSDAMRAGIRPVLYGPPQIYAGLAPEDRPFFQNMGGDGGRWKAEHEWRHWGDFHFEDIPQSDLCVFVPDNNEAGFFRKRTGLPVKPLLAG